ncbi:Spherulation-specific family 4 [Chamaesiphon minutus PCC 6605]|uniref:Spherulation-specific family 4 n=2 Tax=Chamaesiphon TaxID=217161 RepID=K9UG89_CHAP6|nr:Spherulation-specific family 4 [Chamaesiphon minutus PCC 6605]
MILGDNNRHSSVEQLRASRSQHAHFNQPNQMQIANQFGHHSKLQILLPLYIYPNWYAKNNYVWKQVLAAAKKVQIVAIINPNNGPDNAPPNVDYQQGIKDLRQAGIKVIGYVPSNYASRDLQAVKADIDLYLKYFNVDGIFIDEAANKQDKLDYYHQIYRYLKSHSPSSDNNNRAIEYTLIINPGTDVNEDFIRQPVADAIVTFENYRSVWTKYSPPIYQRKHSAQKFAALIHTTANRKLMKSTLDRVVKYKFSYVYITNDRPDTGDRNPWNTLPEYWQAQVNYIQQLNNTE